MLHILLYLGILGLVTSTAYSVIVLVSVLHFRRRRPPAPSPEFAPPVSLLKPLHGTEPKLAEHLEGFFRQDYPEYEILFCARTQEDEGLRIAREVAARFPAVRSRFLTTGEPPYANAKVASLDRMARAARHSILVISDSDVRVTPAYLRAVVAPFADDRVGAVTCPYRGVPSREPAPGRRAAAPIWAALEGVGMSIEMTAGVLAANMLEGMHFALGPTMAVRSRCLAEIGGFPPLGHYCSDDFLLGNLVAARGSTVVLSDHAIDHIVLNTGFVDSMRHQARWSKSTRFSRPKGHLGTALTFSLPYALLGWVAALLLREPRLAFALLAWGIVDRMLIAAAIGGLVVEERPLWRSVLLYPVRDLMGFGFWLASYGSRRILWRGEQYVLERGGSMRPLHPHAAGRPAAERRPEPAERESALST